MFLFLLSGLFLLFGLLRCYFFCCLGGGVFVFAVWAGAQAPPKQQKKKKHAPAQTAKKKKTHAPAPSGRVLFFAVWAGACSFFAVWAGACFFFGCLGRGRVFFAIWAGDGSSLTYPSAWLVFKRPNNKRDRTAKKNGFRNQSPYPTNPQHLISKYIA